MTLRPLTPNDARDFFYSSWDENVYKFIPGYYCDSIAKANEVISKLTSDNNINACVICSSEINFIGVIVAVKKDKNEVEFSCFIDEKYRRKGYAKKATEELLKQYKGYKVFFQIEPENIKSLKLARKLKVKETKDYFMFYLDNI